MDILAAIAGFLNKGPHTVWLEGGEWRIRGPLVSQGGLPWPSHAPAKPSVLDSYAVLRLQDTVLAVAGFKFDLNDPQSLDEMGKIFQCDASALSDMELVCLLMDHFQNNTRGRF